VARRISPGPRHDSVFTYYEAMYDHLESGAFDIDPFSPGVQPELDTVTLNGKQWEEAKALYMPGINAQPGSPEYDRALQHYVKTAIPPSFAWSWAANRHEFEQYRRKIN
jgi:hypothetical protein